MEPWGTPAFIDKKNGWLIIDSNIYASVREITLDAQK